MNVATHAAINQSVISNALNARDNKECIVVHGKTYCEEYDFTLPEVGYTMIAAIIVIAWFFYGVEQLSNDNYLLAFVVFMTPPVLMILLG